MGNSGDWVRDRPGEDSSSQDEDLANTVSCIQAMEKGNGIQDRNLEVVQSEGSTVRERAWAPLPHHFHLGDPRSAQTDRRRLCWWVWLPERRRLEAALPRRFPAPRPQAEGLACLLRPQGRGRGLGSPVVWQEGHFPGLLTVLSLFKTHVGLT